MRKKVSGILLSVIMAAVLVTSGVSKVSADSEIAPEAELEDIMQEETLTEDVAEVISEEAAEVVDEAESAEEEPEELVDEDKEDDVVDTEITGMRVTLENTLEMNLTAVQVKSFMSDVYSDNLIPEGKYINAGESMMIGIPDEFQDQDLGLYDVKITDENGVIIEIPLVPFLDEINGILYRENELVLIRIRDERLEAEEEQISEAEMIQQEAVVSQIMADALAEEVQ